MIRLLALLALLASAIPSPAHELQSVALRLDELPASLVELALKAPLTRAGGSPAVVPDLVPACEPVGEARVERSGGAILRRWRMRCAGGLAGREVRFEGLDPRTPDAMIVARFAGGGSLTTAIDRHEPAARLEVARRPGAPTPLAAFLSIGIEHILLGPDHLLFVLGLMLVVRAVGGGPRKLVSALTAFTLAHSLTLALAVLGIWGLPPRAVEVLIASSIVLLALELATAEGRARHGLAPALTLRKPWLVAFAFGLLHGFGFAGALAAIGLPDHAAGTALFLFNLGVEVGQLLFVAAVLAFWTLARRGPRPAWAPSGATSVATALGGVATYWTLDRLLLWAATLGLPA